MRIGRTAIVGALLVGSLLVIAAKGTGPAARPDAGPQEAEVMAVVVDPASRQPVVLLQGKRDKRGLAVAIGHFEANGIAIPLHGVSPPRPLTHDLMLTVMGDLKASLQRIVITDLRDNVYYAQLHVDARGTALVVDSRPSDAIALALRAKVPILVEDRVFDKAERLEPKSGVTPHF